MTGSSSAPRAWAIALSFAVMSACERRDPPQTPPSWPQIVQGIVDDDPGAVARAAGAVATSRSAARPAVEAMLNHEHWRVRAAACRLLGEQEERVQVALLVPRATDRDWRVRAAAHVALAAVTGRALPTPHRDTPMAERERTLLAWLDERGQQDDDQVRADLCELYADPRHVLLGRPMVAQCLSCHGGRPSQDAMAAARCAGCHRPHVTSWSTSAHAGSLTHLELWTVDADTRTTRRIDLSAHPAMGCAACHAMRGSGPDTEAPSAAAGQVCPVAVAPVQDVSRTCAGCHRSAWLQWRRGLQGPQPRRVLWPRRQVQSDGPADERACLDCHMSAGAEDHGFAARRNAPFLASGIDVAMAPLPNEDGTRRVRVTLSNLAGHAYPTGTGRRAVRLLVSAGDAVEGGRVVATLVPDRPGRRGPQVTPALAPGEQRRYDLPWPDGAALLTCRLVYIRNRHAPGSYEVDIVSISLRWPTDETGAPGAAR